MVSQAFLEFQARVRAAERPAPPATLEERRAQAEAALAAPLAEGVRAEDVEINRVSCIALRRDVIPDLPLVVYFHGGGYRMGSAQAWRAFCSHLVVACRARVLNVDYRLAPEVPFPGAVEDAVAVYRGLLDGGEEPGQIVLAGDSAGAGLAAATLLSGRERGHPPPAGVVCLSPWADLTNRAETFASCAASDQLFSRAQADEAALLYLAGADPEQPLASPVFGDWRGMPPVLIHVGSVEVLLDDAKNLAATARAAGVDARLSIYPEMPHVWHLSYPAFPEAVQAVEEVAAFVREVTRA